MRLGYEPETKRALLVATPSEMRALADQMEAKMKTAQPGQKLTVIELKSEHGWTGKPTDLILEISASGSCQY